MRSIVVSHDVFVAVHRMASAHAMTPNQVLSALLTPRVVPVAPPQLVINLLLDTRFREEVPDDKYLHVLSWLATRHSADFDAFVRRDRRNHAYVTPARHRIHWLIRRRVMRAIHGTRYWVVMNVKPEAKRTFVEALLEYVGYDSPVVEIICSALGFPMRRKASVTF